MHRLGIETGKTIILLGVEVENNIMNALQIQSQIKNYAWHHLELQLHGQNTAPLQDQIYYQVISQVAVQVRKHVHERIWDPVANQMENFDDCVENKLRL